METDLHAGRTPRSHAKAGVMLPPAEALPEAGREAWGDLPQRLCQTERGPVDPVGLDFGPPRPRDEQFLGVSHSRVVPITAASPHRCTPFLLTRLPGAPMPVLSPGARLAAALSLSPSPSQPLPGSLSPRTPSLRSSGGLSGAHVQPPRFCGSSAARTPPSSAPVLTGSVCFLQEVCG